MRRRFRSWSSKIIRSAVDNVDASRFFSPDWVASSAGLRVATDLKALRRFKGFILTGLVSGLTPLNSSLHPPEGRNVED